MFNCPFCNHERSCEVKLGPGTERGDGALHRLLGKLSMHHPLPHGAHRRLQRVDRRVRTSQHLSRAFFVDLISFGRQKLDFATRNVFPFFFCVWQSVGLLMLSRRTVDRSIDWLIYITVPIQSIDWLIDWLTLAQALCRIRHIVRINSTISHDISSLFCSKELCFDSYVTVKKDEERFATYRFWADITNAFAVFCSIIPARLGSCSPCRFRNIPIAYSSFDISNKSIKQKMRKAGTLKWNLQKKVTNRRFTAVELVGRLCDRLIDWPTNLTTYQSSHWLIDWLINWKNGDCVHVPCITFW